MIPGFHSMRIKMSATKGQRRLAITALGVAGALLAAGCGSSSSTATTTSSSSGPDPSSVHIAFFTDALSNAYLTAAVSASKDVASKAGVTMDVFSADWDSAKQLTQIQDAVSSGKYKALVVEAIDGASVCKSLNDAIKQGIQVAVYNAPICGHLKDLYSPGTIGFFGGPDYDYGQLLGQQVIKALGGKGSVAYISGPPASSVVAETTAGVEAALKTAPGIKLVAELDGGWDAAKGLSATQDLVQSHPDIQGIIYGVDQMAIPSIKFLSTAGKLDKIKIVSLGTTSNAATAIKAGQMYAGVVQLPAEEAANATSAAISTVLNKPIDVSGWDATTKIYDVLKDPLLKGSPVLDKSNVDTFKTEWSV